jgi:hypothetical protein
LRNTESPICMFSHMMQYSMPYSFTYRNSYGIGGGSGRSLLGRPGSFNSFSGSHGILGLRSLSGGLLLGLFSGLFSSIIL